MIARGIVLRLALAQLVAWGVSYYLIGVFGTAMAADLGWGAAEVHGGFALGLAVTGLAAPFAGRLVDRFEVADLRSPRRHDQTRALLSCLPRRAA